MAKDNVVTLPVIRVERDVNRRVAVHCLIDPKAADMLTQVAGRHWEGNVGQAASDLLRFAIIHYAKRGGK